MPLSAFAPAKVNLFLHVGPPTADGYHPLCSLMVFADIGDRVSLASADAPPLTIVGDFAPGLPAGPENLVRRAAQAVSITPPPLRLEKALPVASGLGGGSSDAGAALRLLRDGLDDPALEAVAAALGADGAACLWGRPTLAEGRGERLSPAPGLPALHAVLANAGAPVSTPAVYRALDASGAFSDVTPPTWPPDFETVGELAAWLSRLRNDLEGPAIATQPDVGLTLEALAREPEALLARVSGSGGTCFALCADAGAAATLATKIGEGHPDWWVRACRLGGPWPD